MQEEAFEKNIRNLDGLVSFKEFNDLQLVREKVISFLRSLDINLDARNCLTRSML